MKSRRGATQKQKPKLLNPRSPRRSTWYDYEVTGTHSPGPPARPHRKLSTAAAALRVYATRDESRQPADRAIPCAGRCGEPERKNGPTSIAGQAFALGKGVAQRFNSGAPRAGGWLPGSRSYGANHTASLGLFVGQPKESCRSAGYLPRVGDFRPRAGGSVGDRYLEDNWYPQTMLHTDRAPWHA